MGTLRAHGFEVEVPVGWDGRVSVRAPHPPAPPAAPTRPGGIGTAATAATTADATATTATVPVSGEEFPVVHVANFALPAEIGDYGGGATEGMGAGHLLVNLAEFGPASVGTALFGEVAAMPRLRTGDFHPLVMQRPLPGQSGAQRFFTLQDRAFGLYVVLGSHRRRLSTVDVVNDVLEGIRLT
jgi:hypothetical protein